MKAWSVEKRKGSELKTGEKLGEKKRKSATECVASTITVTLFSSMTCPVVKQAPGV